MNRVPDPAHKKDAFGREPHVSSSTDALYSCTRGCAGASGLVEPGGEREEPRVPRDGCERTPRSCRGQTGVVPGRRLRPPAPLGSAAPRVRGRGEGARARRPRGHRRAVPFEPSPKHAPSNPSRTKNACVYFLGRRTPRACASAIKKHPKTCFCSSKFEGDAGTSLPIASRTRMRSDLDRSFLIAVGRITCNREKLRFFCRARGRAVGRPPSKRTRIARRPS